MGGEESTDQEYPAQGLGLPDGHQEEAPVLAEPAPMPANVPAPPSPAAPPAPAAPVATVAPATPAPTPAPTPDPQPRPPQCPGMSNVEGMQQVHVVVNPQTDTGASCSPVQVTEGVIAPDLGGRAYFSKWCTAGVFDADMYLVVPLLGKTVQFTVDLGGAGCGCNVAFYFTAMQKNPIAGACADHYCDANNVCGARCDEVDVMEANSKVFRSTLHRSQDNVGGSVGYGGTGPHTQTWTRNEYGPGSSCIDTNKPFEVKAHFPTHEVNKKTVLQGMMIDLSQDGASCEDGLTGTVGWYKFGGDDAIVALTQALRKGMVPMVSYWNSRDMGWLDGRDINGELPCAADTPDSCPLRGPKFSNLSVQNFTGWLHASTMNLSPKPNKTAKAVDDDVDADGGSTATAVGRSGGEAVPVLVQSSGVATMAGDRLLEPVQLAGGWLQVYQNDDPSKAYYFNPGTGQTTWDRPAEAT